MIIKCFRFVIFAFSVIGCSHPQLQIITYEITARNLSTEAIDSYPQKLISYQNEDSLHRVIVSTFATYSDSLKREIVEKDKYMKEKPYPQSIKEYLEPTLLTDYNHPEIINVADSILNFGDSLTVQFIMRCLQYSSERIQFDNELARELDQGNCTTLSVETILERGKGTCSEYTNLFIALIRRIGIPSRMVVGWIYMPENDYESSHAWAECYIDNYGWLAVDPQSGGMWFPPAAIKLFHGKDFIDCNIKTLPDMYPVTVKILE